MSKQQEIIQALINAYWAEMETVQNYIAHSVNLDGTRAEIIKKALAADITNEVQHAQTLANRIKVLGGTVPGSMDFQPSQKSLQPLADTTDLVSVIRGVIAAEEDAIQSYKEIIRLSDGEDYVTQDLAITLLGDEEEHRREFVGFLKEFDR